MKEQEKYQNRNDNILGPWMSGFQKDELSDPLAGLVGDLHHDQIQQNLQDDDDLTHESGRVQAGYANNDKEPRGGSGGSGHSGGSGGSNNQDMSEFKNNG